MEKRLINECIYSDQSGSLKHHFHDDFEILYVKTGTARISINGHEYTINRGSVVFISRLEGHSLEVLSDVYERYYIIPCSDQLEQFISDARLLFVFRNRSADFQHCVDLSEYADELDECFERIVQEFNTPQKCANLMIAAHLTRILIYAYRKMPQEFNYANKSIFPEIFKIQKYIEANYMNDIKISDIATDHFISNHYLSKCFKALTGYSPKQYLINTRLAHAKFLLDHSNMAVKDVAIKCGFNDVNNFIRIFKESAGLTPYKYRQYKS